MPDVDLNQLKKVQVHIDVADGIQIEATPPHDHLDGSHRFHAIIEADKAVVIFCVDEEDIDLWQDALMKLVREVGAMRWRAPKPHDDDALEDATGQGRR